MVRSIGLRGGQNIKSMCKYRFSNPFMGLLTHTHIYIYIYIYTHICIYNHLKIFKCLDYLVSQKCKKETHTHLFLIIRDIRT